MNATITNNTNFIEIEYNDLTAGQTTIWNKMIILKTAFVGIALDKNLHYVEISLHNGQVLQTSYTRISTPVVSDNLELYEALKSMFT